MKKVLYVLVGFVMTAMPYAAAAQAYYPLGVGYTPYGVWTPTSYGTKTSVGSCVSIVNDLSRGSRGGEVTALQTFIVNNNFPGTGSWMITGYFGAATEAAVRNFQMQQGLPVTGIVEAYTRNAIQRISCGYTSVSPYGNVMPGYTAPSYYSPIYTSPYTYSYPSTVYTPPTPPVPYYDRPTQCTGGYGNYAGCPTPVISYLNPSSGPVGTTVTVVGNGFSAQGNTVHFGNGIIANLSSNDGRSVSFVVPSQLVGYGSQAVALGSYPVSVTNAAGYTSPSVPFVVTGYGGSTVVPTITSISGPTSIGRGMQGTWSITLRSDSGYYYGDNAYVTTSVRWGDENQYPYGYASATQNILIRDTQSLTFTHVYQYPGTYTITYTVTNSAGQSSTASATVTVYDNQVWYRPAW